MALSVIGVGFMRTGTESLKMALEILGYGPCHHMKVVLSDPDQEALWRRVVAGETIPWETLYDGYNSAVDFPTAFYWRELTAHYPESPLILTVRSSESWYASMTKSVFPTLKKLTDPGSVGSAMISQGTFDGRGDDPDHAVAVYEKHNNDVQSAFSSDRLLVYELGSGWTPLCEFLGKPIPDEDYPHSNTAEEFDEFFDKRLSRMNL